MRRSTMSAVLLCLSAFGCSSTTSAPVISKTLADSLSAARSHADAGRELEAYQLVLAIQSVDPEYPGLQAVSDGLQGTATRFSRPIAGMNHPLRHDVDASIGARIGWYIPDRILDLLDVFSFDVHAGFGLYADVHATHFATFAAGGRIIGGLGWHDHRSLGVQAKGEGALSVLMFDGSGRFATRAGTSGADAWGGGHGGVMTPGDEFFQEFMDFWSVGASATLAVIGAEADVHLLEVFDALVGWFFFDPLGDDFATTRGLAMSDSEWGAVRRLARIAGSDEDMRTYRSLPAPAAAADVPQPTTP